MRKILLAGAMLAALASVSQANADATSVQIGRDYEAQRLQQEQQEKFQKQQLEYQQRQLDQQKREHDELMRELRDRR